MSYKVGDRLAFRSGFSNDHIEIHEIRRVTPSGRIVCGRWTLDPDLRIRGRNATWGPWRGEPVTAEVLALASRKEGLRLIRAMKFETLTDEQIAAIVDVINSVPSNGSSDET